MNKREKEIFQLDLDNEDKVLSDLERIYKKALRDIENKIRLLQSDELTNSRIYQIQYQKALKGQIEGILEKLHGDEYSTIQKYLSDTYTNGFVGTMYAMHGQGVPVMIPIDRRAAVKAVVTDSKLSVDLYAALGYDMDKLKKHIREEITRGIATSLTYEQIANNISGYTSVPFANAKRIARTEGHRIQQASADDARKKAKAKGADVVKQWDASLDGATRPLHRRLDGQIREIDEPFEAGGYKVMYPGKFGKPGQDCNCRCVALTRARSALDEKELDTLRKRAEFFGLDKTEDFEDFKRKYLKAAETPEERIIETRKQAVSALKDIGFSLVGHGVDYMPDEQVVVAAKRLQELENHFGVTKDESFTLEAPVLTGKDKKTIAYTRNTKTTGAGIVLNAEFYSKSVDALVKVEKENQKTGFAMPCAEEHLKHYTITHEYGHMLANMMYKRRNGHSVAELDSTKRKTIVASFEKELWDEIRGIAKERNPDFKVTKDVISEYGRKNHAEAFAEVFANALCGKPNELGEAMKIWIKRNGFK